MDDKYKELDTSADTTALEVTAGIVTVVPLIGGAISNVLSGVAQGRKFDRMKEVIEGMASDLRDFHSKTSEEYVKTENFEELLEESLKRVASERNEEKRQIYRRFLVGEIVHPGQDYDEQLRFLRTMEEIQPDHLIVLRALMEEPDPRASSGLPGSPIQTLKERMGVMPEDRIKDLVEQMNDLRVTSVTGLHTMMTARGAQELFHTVTDYGQRFVRYVKS